MEVWSVIPILIRSRHASKFIKMELIRTWYTWNSIIVRLFNRTLMITSCSFIPLNYLCSFLQNICHIWSGGNPTSSCQTGQHVGLRLSARLGVWVENCALGARSATFLSIINGIRSRTSHTDSLRDIKCRFFLSTIDTFLAIKERKFYGAVSNIIIPNGSLIILFN